MKTQENDKNGKNDKTLKTLENSFINQIPPIQCVPICQSHQTGTLNHRPPSTQHCMQMIVHLISHRSANCRAIVSKPQPDETPTRAIYDLCPKIDHHLAWLMSTWSRLRRTPRRSSQFDGKMPIWWPSRASFPPFRSFCCGQFQRETTCVPNMLMSVAPTRCIWHMQFRGNLAIIALACFSFIRNDKNEMIIKLAKLANKLVLLHLNLPYRITVQ